MRILNSARNRVRNLVNRDSFSWTDQDRSSHLRLREFLSDRYPLRAQTVAMGNYTFPSQLLSTVEKHPVVLSGGVEFHIDFEVDLAGAVPLQCHFFEVDDQSVAWFRSRYGDRSDFRINHLGLSSRCESLPVLGDAGRPPPSAAIAARTASVTSA